MGFTRVCFVRLRDSLHRCRSLLLFGVALLAVLLVSSPAKAAELEVDKATLSEFSWNLGQCTETISNSYAWGCFHADDEHPIYHTGDDIFKIRDEERDGHRVGIHWRLEDGSRRGLCYSTFPVNIVLGQEVTETGYCNKDFVEGKRMEFRVGRCDGDTSPCTAISDWRDWSGWVNVTT